MDPQEPGYDSTHQYEELTKAFGGLTDDQGRSAALRLIIHYVGDLHQPLHASSRYDPEYPTGDRGGNSFKLPASDGISNLHAAYDSVMYEFPDDLALPLSVGHWSSLEFSVKSLMKKFPL